MQSKEEMMPDGMNLAKYFNNPSQTSREHIKLIIGVIQSTGEETGGFDYYGVATTSPTIVPGIVMSSVEGSIWEFKEEIFTQIKKRYTPLLKSTFESLLDIRDFLGYQLDHSLGNLSDEAFDDVVKKYLKKPEPVDSRELIKAVELLEFLTDITFDIDTIADIFNVDIDNAERVRLKIDIINKMIE
jgi:hypothetical protein